MKFKPERLVVVDIYENNLYDIEQELKYNYPEGKISAIVASVREKKRLNEIFNEFKPYLVFHAAAHKHVPLMETSPLEAIKNNVFGTLNVVNCATKRLCEMIIQTKNKVSNTEYVAVRFGNVLGSNGSVVPLFKKQISHGGPVTVTHKDITRFFMTIPEAVSLVLQAMSGAQGGEIFVLDMGEPVKIYDMAVKLIKLSGLEPEVDIPIKITGLRPGEKLYEELLNTKENVIPTNYNKIFVAKTREYDYARVNEMVLALKERARLSDADSCVKIMKDIVPEFVSQNSRYAEFNK